MTERQVKSRVCVADHGEVFTAQREVSTMLDLVKQETKRTPALTVAPATCRWVCIPPPSTMENMTL